MRLSTLFLFVFWIGICGINCQETVDKEDKDGGSGNVGIIADGTDSDDEDDLFPTESGELDIDDTTIPSTTDVQSEEPTTTKEKSTTEEEIPTTKTEEVVVTSEEPVVSEELPTTDYEVTEASGDETTPGTDTEGPTTDDEDVTGSGIKEVGVKETTTEPSNEIATETTTAFPNLPESTTDGNDVDNIDNILGDDGTQLEEAGDPEARTDDDENNNALNVGLTTEVVAAVIVGAVCAIIIIAFLVYRLKKRDEGSYALDESTHYTNKDAYKFSAEGKEAFV